MNDIKQNVRNLLDQQTRSGKHKRRKIYDYLARYGIGLGGISVIFAVVLIFFYLLYVVMPIFKSAEIERFAEVSFSTPFSNQVYLDVEEYGEVGLRIGAQGRAEFFSVETGQPLENTQLALPEGSTIVQVLRISEDWKSLGLVLNTGELLVARQEYRISYPDDVRKITPSLSFPMGEQSLSISETPVSEMAARQYEDGLVVAALRSDGQVAVKSFTLEESFLSGEIEVTEQTSAVIRPSEAVAELAVTPGPEWLYTIGEQGEMSVWKFTDDDWQQVQTVDTVSGDTTITNATFLLGNISLLIGDSTGTISQWFPVRDSDNRYQMQFIRKFELGDSPILEIIPEARRKGFHALDASGLLGTFYTTSQRQLLEHPVADGKPFDAALNSRGNRFLVQSSPTGFINWHLDNEHPEISWSSLWNQVWYESYEEPTFTWQSSASSNDFEPKFSLAPLSFGTLKAAFYAMLFAVPLAIFGAIYAAYFMSPKLRQAVKPTIEIMEALPTVILGFLAGLWLAPTIEKNLPGTFLILIMLPLATVLFGWLWTRAPAAIRHRVPDGWQVALLVPVVILVGWLAFAISAPVEAAFFDGNMPQWLSDTGFDFDQRNSIVVGIAMGFAVIPTIFSITEDAVFSVPKHLSNGSLALGASPWQTLTRVVLPTASPGIFSALMIGLGRAVGETMIVLMATGNTPIMDMNIFEGMRTLSANIAVEMPESEVGSSHYRVLFLAAFVLFLFTFVVNTGAEIVRQRLRRKYGSL